MSCLDVDRSLHNQMTVEALLNSLLGIFEIQKTDPIENQRNKQQSVGSSPISTRSFGSLCHKSINDNETVSSSSITVSDDDLSLRSTKDLSIRSQSSYIGLEDMIQARKERYSLASNVVHIENPYGRNIEDVYDGVRSGPTLGSGSSGVVRKVVHRATGIEFAVKCLDLGMLACSNSIEQLRQEIYIMCQLDHPNIVRLVEVYESPCEKEIFLVQELCSGGELFDGLEQQPDFHYSEMRALRYVKQMISAVRYIHSQGIIHRDLKLENFLFSSSDDDSELKLIDFGLSKYFRKGEYENEPVGSPYSVAPEVLLGQYDERSDVWAVGVITFLLLSGDPPFGGCGDDVPLHQLRKNIIMGDYSFDENSIWQFVSNEAKHFIKAILVTDPRMRPNIQELYELPWLKETKKGRKQTTCLSPKVVDCMLRYRYVDSLRRHFREILSFTLCPDQLKQLRKEFAKIDLGCGAICFESLKQEIIKSVNEYGQAPITHEQIEEIFDALRLHKSDNSINWHEFIAAELTFCAVDERNLRLAFDMLDSQHKGYICLSDFLDIVGCEAHGLEEHYSKIFLEGLSEIGVKSNFLSYEDFLLLVK